MHSLIKLTVGCNAWSVPLPDVGKGVLRDAVEKRSQTWIVASSKKVYPATMARVAIAAGRRVDCRKIQVQVSLFKLFHAFRDPHNADHPAFFDQHLEAGIVSDHQWSVYLAGRVSQCLGKVLALQDQVI